MMRDHKPPRQPLLWGALAFSLGLWMGARAWRPPSWWVAAMVAFVLAALWFLPKRAWLAKGLSLGTWVLLGAFLIQIRSPEPSDARLRALDDGREVTLIAHVMREGYARSSGSRSTRESIDVETEEIESAAGSSPVHSNPDQSDPIRAGVRLAIYELSENSEPVARRPEDPPVPLLRYGTRLRIRAKLHPARNFRNPGAFDYEGYLRDNGISVLGSARAEGVESLPGFAGSRIELWRTRIHSSIVAKIHQLWPAPEAALMDAMVLGEDSFLRNGTRTEFQRSGTYHVLVVSGMNLSILAFAIFWMCVCVKRETHTHLNSSSCARRAHKN